MTKKEEKKARLQDIQSKDRKAMVDVFNRDGHRCRRCGINNYLTPAHIISRRHMNIRWDLDNLLTLCFDCHRYLDDHPSYMVLFAIKNDIDINELRKRAGLPLLV